MNDLAYFGGTPAFQEKVHVGRPNIGNRERFLERVNDLLDRRWLTNNGPFVQELEQHIADKLGVKHCIAVCNGTVGLELAIRAAELKGEVIVPAMTFIATAHALKWLGIRPVFSDIDPRTHTLDPNRIEEMITPETTGILAVHLWGRPCGIEALEEIAQRHNLKLLFDAAHAFGCSYKGRMIGNFGDAEVFSFHATKFFNTLEGGAVVTNDDALARKIRLMKDFGFADWDSVISVGTNGKMNEVSAAMGLTLLENLDGFVEANRRNYHQYRRELADIPGVKMATYDESESCNYQYIVFDIDEVVTGVNRNQLMQILWAENVLARRYFHPGCHRAEPYRSLPPIAGQSLPETEKALAGLLVLPTGSTLGSDDISTICRIIRLVIAQAAEVQERWQTPVNMPVVAIAKAPVTL